MIPDCAAEMLDNENLTKLTQYVDLVKSGKTGLALYFFGTGGNGKSTLAKALRECDTFGPNGKILFREEPTNDELRAENLDKSHNYVFMTNVLPDGIHPDRIVHFMKKF